MSKVQAITVGQDEAEQRLDRWFKRRYPTAKERLDYARRTYAEWMRSAPR